ncbi:hypothetical protein ACFRH4_50445 [Streptomyces mirabilis]|uniref:hypothetical protein n=1 Tax=Streptomyces mirabilis TaxID=68239 RepID=UPI0036BC20F7
MSKTCAYDSDAHAPLEGPTLRNASDMCCFATSRLANRAIHSRSAWFGGSVLRRSSAVEHSCSTSCW